MGFKERLKEKRIDAGLTQSQLAEKAGVTAGPFKTTNWAPESPPIWRLFKRLRIR